LSETPQTTEKPGDGAFSAASTSETVSAGESQVDRCRVDAGSANALPIRRQTTSMPYRSAYIEPRASMVTFATP
jgi:hypothetical protein